MAEATFKDIPEIFEVELGEALTARTECLSTFRELGPPDLCHVVKSTGRSGHRDLGSYHYVSGVDASSSASLAAYINSLTYSIEDNSAWFSNKTTWKVRNGVYCCFNAFSRVDMRVDVKIPGGVAAYVIDLRGERHEATPEIWSETFVSALLRSILYSDDHTYSLEAWRRLDPITSVESEIRFLQAAEQLFMKGWQVGSDPEIQVATIVSNHLTAGIMKYFGDSGRFAPAVNLFEKLAAKEPEVASLLARSYIGLNEEVKAVQVMSHYIRLTPSSYTLLHAQASFLRSHSRLSDALKLAKQAVNAAPSEFVTWETLTELYIELGQYENALLTLNSCPMFTFNGKDAHRTLNAARVSLPFEKMIGEVLPDRERGDDDEADPALLRLPAPGLRGTWARAYALLTKLVARIGWDELLKSRSAVFVMEEEYRMQKARDDVRAVTDGVIHEDGTMVVPGGKHKGNDSTTAIKEPSASPPLSPENQVNGARKESLNALYGATEVPEIRISSESSDAVHVHDRTHSTTQEPPPTVPEEEGDVTNAAHEEEVQKPALSAEEPKPEPSSPIAIQHESFSFSNKRLCERWLDNLFMVLYEDLRIYTIFRAEVAHFKTQHVAYRKTSYEWEILGDLSSRLHHREEAKEAWQRCLDGSRYSVKPWLKLMELYAEEGDIQRTCQTAIRVAAYAYAEYSEMTYPHPISRAFFKLGRIHGHQKIQFTLLSMGLPESIMKIMEGYLTYGRVFKVEGWDF